LVHQEEASEMAIKMDLNHSNPKLKVQTWTEMRPFMTKRTELTTINRTTHFNELVCRLYYETTSLWPDQNVSYNHNFI
jgi:hypothetical protein